MYGEDGCGRRDLQGVGLDWRYTLGNGYMRLEVASSSHRKAEPRRPDTGTGQVFDRVSALERHERSKCQSESNCPA